MPMDFDPVPDLEINGFRLASISLITPTTTSGDAYLVCPDGRTIDVAWRSEPSATWPPPTLPGSLGVVTEDISEHIVEESDLGPVLEACVGLMEPILVAGIESLR